MRNVAKRPILALTVVATAAIARATAVGFNGAQAASGAAMLGVADTSAIVGDELAVDVIGTTSCLAGAAIAAGALIEVGASGKFVTKTTGKTVGRALTAATGADSDFSALLIPSDA